MLHQKAECLTGFGSLESMGLCKILIQKVWGILILVGRWVLGPWAQFCCEMRRGTWCETNTVIGPMQKLSFINKDSQSCFYRCFESSTNHALLYPCRWSTNGYIYKFVAVHGTAVQPACINIVFGYKQAEQYSRIHQLGSELSVEGHKMLNRIGCTCISLS